MTGKLFVFGLLFTAAVTAYQALPIEGFVPRAAASIVYLVNPFVYGRLHYGQLFVLAGYAVLPWVALRIRQLLLARGVTTALLAALGMWLLGVLSPHIFLIAGVLTGSLVVAHTIAARNKLAYLARLAPGILLAVSVALAASAYWLIPLFQGSGPEGSALAGIGSGDLVAYAAVPDPQLGLLPNLVGLYGFWAEDTGRFTSMKDFAPLWPAVLGVLVLVGVVGAIAAFKQRRDRLAPWVGGLLAAALIALILEMGVSSTWTSWLVTWLDAHSLMYRGMRDAGKWAAILALVYSQLVGLGAAVAIHWLRQRAGESARAEWVAAVAIGLLLACPLYYGNGLLFGAHGEIRPSQYPSGWYSADRVLAADPHPGRTLFLPWHGYLALSFVRNENSVVASPASLFFSTPVLASTDPEVSGIPAPAAADQIAISNLVSAREQAPWAQVLSNLDIKYILLAREVDWESYGYLDHQQGLARVGDYGTIVLYRNNLVR